MHARGYATLGRNRPGARAAASMIRAATDLVQGPADVSRRGSARPKLEKASDLSNLNRWNGGDGVRHTGVQPHSVTFRSSLCSKGHMLTNVLRGAASSAAIQPSRWGRRWGRVGAMARQRHTLSARTVATLTKPGRRSDGGGLYLKHYSQRRPLVGVHVEDRW